MADARHSRLGLASLAPKRSNRTEAAVLRGQDGAVLPKHSVHELIRLRASNITSRNLHVLEGLLGLFEDGMQVHVAYQKALYDLKVWEAKKQAGLAKGKPPGLPIEPPPIPVQLPQALKIMEMIANLSGLPPGRLNPDEDPEKPVTQFDSEAFNALQRGIDRAKRIALRGD